MEIVVAALVLAGGAGIWLLTSRFAAERDWVYNRHNPRPPGSGSLGLLETIYQPSLEHVIEERASERRRGDQAATGEGDR